MIALGGSATELKYLPAAEIQVFTINDVSRNNPAPRTSAKDMSRSFTRLKRLRAWLEAVSSGTLQMVFSASLNSWTTAVAPKNNVTSPSKVATMPLEDRCTPSIML
jgi:hypothetical protein